MGLPPKKLTPRVLIIKRHLVILSECRLLLGNTIRSGTSYIYKGCIGFLLRIRHSKVPTGHPLNFISAGLFGASCTTCKTSLLLEESPCFSTSLLLLFKEPILMTLSLLWLLSKYILPWTCDRASARVPTATVSRTKMSP